MKPFIFSSLALIVCGHVMAADPIPHGASAVISGIKCKTLDMSPDDGVAPYTRLLTTPNSISPYFVNGSLSGSSAQTVSRSRSGSGLESIYLTLDEQGSSGSAMLAPSSNGTVGLLSASSATAPGRVFDTYNFAAYYYPLFAIGPKSAVECRASYVITAWAKPVSGAPNSARSTAQAFAYEPSTGEGWTGSEVTAVANPANGKRYGQKSGQLVLVLYNFGGGERTVLGAFQASVYSGQP